MLITLNLFYNYFKLLFLLFFISLFPLSAFGKGKVLDLGEIEITGEVRRPNLNLIYSKKYMNKAVVLIAREELKKLEKEILKPAQTVQTTGGGEH